MTGTTVTYSNSTWSTTFVAAILVLVVGDNLVVSALQGMENGLMVFSRCLRT
jgi:hypothetical protein